jgi:hypothetical protein
MIYVIQYNEGDVIVSPEAIYHKPFKELIDRDDTQGKARAKRDFAFLFLTKDPRSTLSVYPPNTRTQKALEMIYGKDIRIDRKLAAAQDYYEELIKQSSPTYVFWEAAKKALDNLTNIMRSTTWGEDSVFSIKEFASYIKEAEGMAATLANLERKVNEEIIAAPKLKGQNTVNYFEQ